MVTHAPVIRQAMGAGASCTVPCLTATCRRPVQDIQAAAGASEYDCRSYPFYVWIARSTIALRVGKNRARNKVPYMQTAPKACLSSMASYFFNRQVIEVFWLVSAKRRTGQAAYSFCRSAKTSGNSASVKTSLNVPLAGPSRMVIVPKLKAFSRVSSTLRL